MDPEVQKRIAEALMAKGPRQGLMPNNAPHPKMVEQYQQAQAAPAQPPQGGMMAPQAQEQMGMQMAAAGPQQFNPLQAAFGGMLGGENPRLQINPLTNRPFSNQGMAGILGLQQRLGG